MSLLDYNILAGTLVVCEICLALFLETTGCCYTDNYRTLSTTKTLDDEL